MAGVVTLGVLAGAGVAVAATSSPGQPAAPVASASPAPSAAPSAARPHFPPKGAWRMRPPGGGPGPFALGGPGALGGLFGAVHGSAVVAKPGGGYQTIAFQNGKVTAVSSTSVTLHSADGYSHSYRVTSATIVNAQRDGIGSIKAGNQVIVTATVSGGTDTATRVIDVSMLQQGLHRFFGGAHPPNFKAVTP